MARAAADATQVLSRAAMQEMFWPFSLPAWLPLPHQIAKRRAGAVLHGLIDAQIASVPDWRGELLARLDEGALDAGATSDLSLPHERALARAIGLPAGDGLVPWAAWERQLAHQDAGTMPWAWLTPCHWEVGMDHVRMHAPAHLRLSPDHSRAMFDAMRPYFEEDGIALTWEAPDRWLAQGEVFLDLPCASLDRVVGRLVDDWLPRRSATGTLQRLQQEMQMLLYTHPVNEAREGQRLPTVNSFWVSGAGSLAIDSGGRPPAGVKVEPRLRDAALDEIGRAHV